MRTAMRLGVAVLMLGVSGCQLKQPSPDDLIMSAAINAVRDGLRDPQSAQFSKWKFFPLQKAACGEVNAKNGFGGYSGRAVFSYVDGKATVADDDRLSQLDVQLTCVKLVNREYQLSRADERAARKKRQAERAKEASQQQN